MTAEPAISLRGVAHRFGPRWVLRGIDLLVGRGHAVALMGANGTGKTTLLRILATLLKPTRGTGTVLGADLRSEPDLVRERIAYFAYLPALYEDLTAAENLAFSLRMRGQRPEAGEIEQALERVDLGSHGDARVRGLSTGMRRRVSLARVLLQRPELLLLDEPYAAFDESGILLVDELVADVRARGGAVVAATHDLPRTGHLIDRLLRLDGGTLTEEQVPPAGFPYPDGSLEPWRPRAHSR